MSVYRIIETASDDQPLIPTGGIVGIALAAVIVLLTVIAAISLSVMLLARRLGKFGKIQEPEIFAQG